MIAFWGWGRYRRAAFTLIETTIVMIIAVAALAAGSLIYANHLDNQANQAAAQQLRYVGDAFSRYVHDRHANLLAAFDASGSASMSISLESLKPDYLPSSFQNKTPFGHEYVLAVRRPDPARNEIQALIHTQYTDAAFALGPARAQEIARLLGVSAGFTTAEEPGQIQTIFNQYSINPSDFGVSLSDGAIVSALFVGEQQQTAINVDQLLHRKAMGDPELNRMDTALDMASNDVLDAGLIHATGAYVGALGLQVQGVVDAQADITAGGSIAATGPVSGSYLLPNGPNVVEGSSCNEAPDGAIAKDANGKILSCQSGLWQGTEKILVQSGTAETTTCASWYWIAQYICYYTPYTTVYFSQPFESAPQILVSPSQNFPYTPCAGGASDAQDHVITSVSTTSFVLYGGASPTSPGSCGEPYSSGRSVSRYHWIAIGKRP